MKSNFLFIFRKISFFVFSFFCLLTVLLLLVFLYTNSDRRFAEKTIEDFAYASITTGISAELREAMFDERVIAYVGNEEICHKQNRQKRLCSEGPVALYVECDTSMINDSILIEYMEKSCSAATQALDFHDEFIIVTDINYKSSYFYKVVIKPVPWSIKQGASIATLRIIFLDMTTKKESYVSAVYVNSTDIGPNRAGWHFISKKIIQTILEEVK